jgi:hypothetical protein
MISLNLSPFLLTVSWSSSLFLISQAQNLQFGQWKQINYRATNVITGRYSHAGAFLSSTNEYLVFGGAASASLSDLHSINMTSLQSIQFSASTPLGGRGGIASASDFNNFYVHGGWSGVGKFYLYNMMISYIPRNL